jgi:hypothetical protein
MDVFFVNAKGGFIEDENQKHKSASGSIACLLI